MLVVKDELQEMSLEAHAQLGSYMVSNFAPGNLEKRVFVGVYNFTGQVRVETYLDSELWNGIVAHPNLANFKTEAYIIAPISIISNGVPTL